MPCFKSPTSTAERQEHSICCFLFAKYVYCLINAFSQGGYSFIAYIVVVAHHFVYACFGPEFDNAVGCCLNELMVMWCKEDVTFIGDEIVVEGLYAFQIEVIGRCVEYKTVGVTQHHASSIQKHQLSFEWCCYTGADWKNITLNACKWGTTRPDMALCVLHTFPMVYSCLKLQFQMSRYASCFLCTWSILL